MTKRALFPGCSLEGTAGAFDRSLAAVFRVVGEATEELRDWSCCGASSAHAVDHDLHLSLTSRNLALAEAQGFDEVVAPCAACFNRLAVASQELGADAELLARINDETGFEYRGRVKVRNVLDLLANVVGPARVAEHVTRPLSGLKVACYYGCLNTRVPRAKAFDDVEYPMAMDRLVEALGAEAIPWGYKTDCCGASLFVTSESTAARLVARILKDAVARGADCIAVACPMCHNNLDTKQADIREAHGITRPMPVVFVTQLMGAAFGVDATELKLGDGFVPLTSLELTEA